ncbi:MAG: S41 family peptidase [Dehalococcoidia bacterium]|nr:S41 family peptidase [Dehalococcoidia bacterium]
MRNTIKILLGILLVVIIVTPYLGPGCGNSWRPSSPMGAEFGLVEEAWLAILEDYVDSENFDRTKLSQGAIRGMIEALNDPYTTYLDKEQYQISRQSLEGSFGGIGAEVTADRNGQIIIVAPIIGTPAQRAGIMSGDRVLAIDGESTEGMSMIQAILKIRGKPGTEVTLTILHEEGETPEDVIITREEIKLTSVTAKMLSGGIAHIEVYYFSSHTGSDFISALTGVLQNEAKGIVLDLRDNPGGVLSGAVDIASQFLKEGVVVMVSNGDEPKEVWEVEKGGLATDAGFPLAVLINGASASASEVVAGALQDHGRAEIIGTTSLGKGTVNHFRQLSDGSAIYISIARWHTPEGRRIEGQGIIPDQFVEMTPEDIEEGRDPQLERAIEYVRNTGKT